MDIEPVAMSCYNLSVIYAFDSPKKSYNGSWKADYVLLAVCSQTANQAPIDPPRSILQIQWPGGVNDVMILGPPELLDLLAFTTILRDHGFRLS